jgi:nitrous oxidase accessory protein NosD
MAACVSRASRMIAQARYALTRAACVAALMTSATAIASSPYSPIEMYCRGAAVLAADGNEYRTLEAVTGKDPVTAKDSPWRLSRAVFDMTLDVPGRFPTIHDAMQFIAGATITDNATVTVQVAPGKYELDRPLVIGHPDGRRITLRGAKDPAKCVLSVGNHDGIVVDGQRALCVEGLTIEAATAKHAGVSVSDNSYARLRHVAIKGCQFGVSVARRSHLDAEDVAVTTKRGIGGFHATAASTGSLRNCTAELQANPRGTDLTFGYAAWFSSAIECSTCTSIGWHDGFFAGNAASLDLIDSGAKDNSFGAVAYLGSSLRAAGSTFQDNTDYGLNIHAATAVVVGCRFLDNKKIAMRSYGASMIDLRGRPCEVTGSELGMQSIAGGIFLGVSPNIGDGHREEEVYQFPSGSQAVFHLE